MDLELAGKNALITGSSRGIGFEIAKKLSNEGCKVVLNSRNQNSLQEASARLGDCLALPGDVTKPEFAKQLVNETIRVMGRLDILVCNVGSGKSVPPGKETLEAWQQSFEVNLWSATNMVEAAWEPLCQSKGTILCVSSICGWETIPGAPVTYSAAKAALNAFVKGISRPLGKLGVRINAVAPGNIMFDGSVWSRKLEDNPVAVHEMLNREVSIGKLGMPQEIANVVAFLCSPNSSFASGGVWVVDGGQVRS